MSKAPSTVVDCCQSQARVAQAQPPAQTATNKSQATNKPKKKVGRAYTPSEKARALERAAEIGPTAASEGLSCTGQPKHRRNTTMTDRRLMKTSKVARLSFFRPNAAKIANNTNCLMKPWTDLLNQ